MLSVAIIAALAAQSPILHYVRSNRDGSNPEHVVHYRPSRTDIAVYKWVSKCTQAAYVTAEMDAGFREAKLFTAGKVAKDGSQSKFGILRLDPSGPALDLAVDLTSEKIRERHRLKARPFLLYDFDFADLNAVLQENRDEGHFAFALPVIWPVEGPTIFRNYGTLHVTHGGNEVRLGRPTKRFDLGVVGEESATGAVWVDIAEGFIIEAELGLPNHLEYRDFRLRLERVEPGSKDAWDALTRSQHANCPAGN